MINWPLSHLRYRTCYYSWLTTRTLKSPKFRHSYGNFIQIFFCFQIKIADIYSIKVKCVIFSSEIRSSRFIGGHCLQRNLQYHLYACQLMSLICWLLNLDNLLSYCAVLICQNQRINSYAWTMRWLFLHTQMITSSKLHSDNASFLKPQFFNIYFLFFSTV